MEKDKLELEIENENYKGNKLWKIIGGTGALVLTILTLGGN
ncbi:hypothetical protein [Fodinibius sp. AD559]